MALATGTADVPRRLGIPGEDLEFVTHRPPIHHQARKGYPSPIGSMYGIYTYIWLIFMVNVGKYAIH